jgi:hypothetical protein
MSRTGCLVIAVVVGALLNGTSRSEPPSRPLDPCVVSALRALPAESHVRLWRLDGPALGGLLQPLAEGDSLLRVQVAPAERPPFTSVPLRTLSAVDVIQRGRAQPLLVVLGIAAGALAGIAIAGSVEGDDGWSDPRIFGPLVAGPVGGGWLMASLSHQIPVTARLSCGGSRPTP